MKITRRLLVRLIKTSIQETKRYIGSPDGGVTPADRAFQRAEEKDMYAADVHPKIAGLMDDEVENRRMGRELASAIAPPDSQYAQFGELTPEEETAIDHIGFDKASEESFPEEGVEQLIDPGDLFGAMKSKSEGILSRFNFRYIEDIGFPPDTDYEDNGDMFRFHAQTLGCEVEDLAFVDSEDPAANETLLAIYEIMRERNATELDIPGDIGNYGQNSLYDVDGLKVLLTGHFGGYYTATICGQ